ncbi:MAG: glutamate synthase large subunit [Alphaproteobacteria bacterium]
MNHNQHPIAQAWQTESRLLEQAGIDTTNHDACGVGFVAAIDGKASRRVVEMGIAALRALFHRGAVDADGKTGDGAGIHVDIPQDFFKDYVRQAGRNVPSTPLAVGQMFMPRNDLDGQEQARSLVEGVILEANCRLLGWRQVPVNIAAIGARAEASRPEIEQVIFTPPAALNHEEERERLLYQLRRRIEQKARLQGLNELYICSFSARSIIYKGMFLAEQLTEFYPDLLDERFISRFALYHQRYSTNTFSTWRLAQPFRLLAHNGEINTLRGNVNWMRAHETRLNSPLFADYMDDMVPVIQAGGSDSAALDNVFELMVQAGREGMLVKSLLIPEAADKNPLMPQSWKDFYSYSNSVIEPWDGPAALAIMDGQHIFGSTDRNGLRPMRYAITNDDLLVLGSEAGVVRLDEATIIEKGAVAPGSMIGVDLQKGLLLRNDDIKNHLAQAHPYGEWVKNITVLDQLMKNARNSEQGTMSTDAILQRLVLAGLSHEDLELIIQPMAEEAKEAIGSMGDDTPLAVLSGQYRGLHHFFRQKFSQVTNPPIDSLRERQVMSLRTRLGNLGNILEESEDQCHLLQLETPILTNSEFATLKAHMGSSVISIDCIFPVAEGEEGLKQGLARLRTAAEQAINQGARHLILSDVNVDAHHAPIPLILAVGAVHTHLIRQKLRTYTSLNVHSGECFDVHHFAVLIGAGATTITPYLALEVVANRHKAGLLQPLTLAEAVANYKKSLAEGMLKIMSKMGISVISSYRGANLFEAIGLSRTLVAEYFLGCPSRLSGLGLSGIARRLVTQHALAFQATATLPIGGFYRQRHRGEQHAWEAEQIHLLQEAVTRNSYSLFRKYSDLVQGRAPIQIRDLLDFRHDGITPIPLEQVEPITSIRQRFVTPGMSLGALSLEAHGTLNVAMNRMGAKSDSGEGGEDSSRYQKAANGDNWNSAIKQVASGRFGVTMEYLNQARELEIKVAQGAKPGEGGQLPAFKVTEMIARFRHATPGVSLISPPPHHDIYSIEDLSQLIYDLKQANPDAMIGVKLVASHGIGTIASGVVKANADIILISGHVGGTGASPQSSIKHAGIPWEMGLAEAHQMLLLNRLRQRVILRTDGGLKTGRDIVMAAMLGAEEFGIGTAALVAMGCIMVRQCHSNTCPVGVCTQDEALRARFTGTPEKVINLFTFIAEEVREILASLGLSSLEEAVGRTDLLHQVSRGAEDLDDLDLNPLLVRATPEKRLAEKRSTDQPVTVKKGRNPVPDTLDARIINDAAAFFERGEKMQLAYGVNNTQRTIGTRISALITRRFGMQHFPADHLTLRLSGSCGQSLGAFAVQGLKLEVLGEANDYVGKGLSGASIVVRPSMESQLEWHNSTIIGNTVLYGATAGQLYAAGRAGERFCVRNSGATAVIEGCGANACEYMTGGVAVILGSTGANFAAGMSGGMAYVLDRDGLFPRLVNDATVLLTRVEQDYYANQLLDLIKKHHQYTSSPLAATIIEQWVQYLPQFWQIVPKEIVNRLAEPIPSLLAAE